MKKYSLRVNIAGEHKFIKAGRSEILNMLEVGGPDFISTKPIENMPVDLHNKIAEYNTKKQTNEHR